MQWNNNSSRVETSSRRWMATVLHINCWKALHRDLTIKKHSEYRKCKGPCSQMAKDTGITVQSLISTSTDSFLWTQYPSLSNLPQNTCFKNKPLSPKHSLCKHIFISKTHTGGFYNVQCSQKKLSKNAWSYFCEILGKLHMVGGKPVHREQGHLQLQANDHVHVIHPSRIVVYGVLIIKGFTQNLLSK